jgi:prepilin-type processing-associated H-X9-DG protein
LADGEHAVNRGAWSSLQDGKDCRRDQIHLDRYINVLYGDGSAERKLLEKIHEVPSSPQTGSNLTP